MKRFLLLAAWTSSLFAGSLYVGTWPNDIVVIDETTYQVIDRIKLQSGRPPRSLTRSYDHKKLYVVDTMNTIEVIDVATRKSISSFNLGSGNKQVRISAVTPDPQDKLLYTVATTAEKKLDRWEIGKPKITVIDVDQKKIAKEFDYPAEEMNAFSRFANFKVSPDGKYLYQFRENILVFDTNDFKIAEKIELAKPLEPGIQNVGIGGQIASLEEPGFITALFNSTDPIVRRRIFGIARLDLSKRTFEFTPVGPSTTGMMGLYVTPDRKKGYTVAMNGFGANQRCEFWQLDLATGKVERTQEFPGRSRFSFGLSTNGEKMYIYGAGYEVEVYDAASMKPERVVDINGDITSNMLIVAGQ
jgi:DNA-binding beta-propeller fold protein YncE